MILARSVGVVFTLNLIKNITGYTAVSLELTTPDGVITKTPDVFATNPGVLKFRSVLGDLPSAGKYLAQAFVTMADGDVVPTDIAEFTVEDKTTRTI